MDLTLDDKAELVFLSTSGHRLSAACGEVKQLHSEKKRSVSFHYEGMMMKIVDLGSVGRRWHLLIRRPVINEGIEVALQNFVQADLHQEYDTEAFTSTFSGRRILYRLMSHPFKPR